VRFKASAQRSRIDEVPEIEFLQLGSAVTFFLDGAILKYNRIAEAESIYSSAGVAAMQCCVLFIPCKGWKENIFDLPYSHSQIALLCLEIEATSKNQHLVCS